MRSADGTGRIPLSETLTVTVPGPEEEPAVTLLTARIDDAPDEHEGEGKRFEVRVAFSEPVVNSYAYVDDAATATNGSVRTRSESTDETIYGTCVSCPTATAR